MENSNNTSKKTTIPPFAPQKKRSVISFSNLSQEILAVWREKYPKGYQDYMGDIMKIDKPDGTFFYAVSLEVPDAIYLVKVEVKIDDYDEAENLFSQGGDMEGDEPDEFPDDDTGGSYPEEEEPNE
jgi:hypothetical protein